MKKIFILSVLLFLLSSCAFFGGKIKDDVDDKLVVNGIETGSEKIEFSLLDKIGNTKEEIVESYYSDNKNKQKEIKKWLSNSDNGRSSEKGDIIEFLDYCEKIQKKVKNNNDLNNYLFKYDNEIYYQITGSKKKMNKDIFINNLKKIMIKEKTKSKSGIGDKYNRLINDFIEKKEINCKKYFE